MPRIKIELPEKFIFKTKIPVRITDLNYGGHLGNDAMLSIIHEARLQCLQFLGGSELDLFGTSVIMGDVAIVFKAEAFHQDMLTIEIMINDFGPFSFDMVYSVTKQLDNKTVQVAIVKTGMVCFNYTERKRQAVPEGFKAKIDSLILK